MRRYPDIITRAIKAAHLETHKLVVSNDADTLARAADNRDAYIRMAVTQKAPASVLQVLTDTGWRYVTAVFPADLESSDSPAGPFVGADKLDHCTTLYPNLQFRLI